MSRQRPVNTSSPARLARPRCRLDRDAKYRRQRAAKVTELLGKIKELSTLYCAEHCGETHVDKCTELYVYLLEN